MSKYKKIKDFYDDFAQHFAQTRKKKRPEREILRSQLSNYRDQFGGSKKRIHIIDIGCGSGRLYPLILEVFGDQVKYTGIDISPELIEIARKEYPKADFQSQDMITYLEAQPQESVDIVVSLASFQHLETLKDRRIVLRNIYRILYYQGVHISINWSFSDRFLQKFRKQMMQAVGKWIYTRGKTQINDVLIPRTDKTRQGIRFYHIFRLKEIIQLHKQSGFVIQTVGYTTLDGTSKNRRISRNTFINAKKQIYAQ